MSKAKSVANLESSEVNIDNQAGPHDDTMLLPPAEETPDSPKALDRFATELDDTIVEQVVADQDHDNSQDLEAALLSVGTEWADAAKELSEGSVTSEERNLMSVPPTKGIQDTWAQVVSKRNCKSPVMVNKDGTCNSSHSSHDGLSSWPLRDSDAGKQTKKRPGPVDGEDIDYYVNLSVLKMSH